MTARNIGSMIEGKTRMNSERCRGGGLAIGAMSLMASAAGNRCDERKEKRVAAPVAKNSSGGENIWAVDAAGPCGTSRHSAGFARKPAQRASIPWRNVRHGGGRER